MRQYTTPSYSTKRLTFATHRVTLGDMKKQQSIRFPLDLYREIENLAKQEERTVTGQIIYILREYFKTLKKRKS